MSRSAWHLVKEKKGFYVRAYRISLRVLLLSLIGNLVLGLAIIYVYWKQPEPDFYATNGITAPMELAAMKQPNNSSTALLPNDPEAPEENKLIPN